MHCPTRAGLAPPDCAALARATAQPPLPNLPHNALAMIRLRARTYLSALFVAAAIAVAGWQTDAFAQNKLPRLGVLTLVPPNKDPSWLGFLRRSLAQQGWIEGKTVSLVVRDAQGSPSNYSQAAAELVSQKVDVIYADSAPAMRAAFAATKSIPIVGSDYTNDPVAAGYAKSYARPGGNVTGVFLDAPEFAAKWLELMREIVPNLRHVAAVWDPSPGDAHVRALTSAAASMGIQVQVVQVRKPEDIDGAAAALSTLTQAIVVLPSPMLFVENARLVSLAMKRRLSAISMAPAFADAGGLLAYGPNQAWTYERGAIMVGKVLRGTKPGDLPIERPIKFDLVAGGDDRHYARCVDVSATLIGSRHRLAAESTAGS
jgi:putative tryptophan/tyrosine transport system substrate-binding protein